MSDRRTWDESVEQKETESAAIFSALRKWDKPLSDGVLQGNIEKADRLIRENRAAIDERQKRTVLTPIPEEALLGIAVFRDVSQEVLAADVLSQGYIDRISETANQRIHRARETVARERRVPIKDIHVNRVTLMNTIAAMDREAEIKKPTLRPVESWDAMLTQRLVKHEPATFNLYKIVDRDNGVVPDELTKRLAELGTEELGSGHPMLARRKELADEDWLLCRVKTGGQSTDFYFPESMYADRQTLKQRMQGFAAVDQDMERLIGDRSPESMVTEYYIVSSMDFCPRGGGHHKGQIVLVESIPTAEIPAHEKVHAALYDRFGGNRIKMVEEGIAVFFTQEEFPGGPMHIPQNIPYAKEIMDAICQEESAETLLMSNRGISRRLTKEFVQSINPHEFTYPFGGAFVRFFVESYGKDRLLELYRLTAQSTDNLEDPKTGRSIVKEGVLQVSSEEDLMEAVIAAMGIDVSDLKRQFVTYAKKMRRKPY